MPHDILIVDEDASALTEVMTALALAGHPATSAPSFRDGIRILTTTTPALLIGSVKLGPYNGLHLLLRGRAEHPALPMIMIGPASEVVAREAHALGAAAYLTQPVEIDQLMTTVAELLDSADDDHAPLHVCDLPVLFER